MGDRELLLSLTENYWAMVFSIALFSLFFWDLDPALVCGVCLGMIFNSFYYIYKKLCL